MKKPLNREILYGALGGVFCASLIISNILAFKTFCIGPVVLPSAVILFPVVYITNDILAEVFGFDRTRRIIWVGFAMNVIAVLAYHLAIVLPAPGYFSGQEAFQTVLSNSARVLCASLSAYLVGSMVNAKMMEQMRKSGSLMWRCVASTMAGEGLDAVIFITVAFLGTMPVASLLIMAVSQAVFKTVYEIICFPLTRICIRQAKTLSESK